MNKGKVVATAAEFARNMVWTSVYTSFGKMMGLGTLVPTRLTDEKVVIFCGRRSST